VQKIWTLVLFIYFIIFVLNLFSGEIVQLTHISRGIDKDGVLQADIAVRGNIPEFPANAEISLEPYTEDYIQTGPGKTCSNILNTLI